MKNIFFWVLRIGIAVGCFVYALWGVDLSKLLAVMATFKPLALIVFGGLTLVTVIPTAWRLRFLMERRVGVTTAWKAVVMGQSLNNVLPARLGEMAKAFYLRREGEMSMGQSLEVVFWERFFDLNALLVVGAAMAFSLGQRLVLYPLLGLVGGAWCFLVLVRLWPKGAHGLLRLVPSEKLRLMFAEMLLLFEAKLKGLFLLRLGSWTLIVWIGYSAICTLGLFWVANLPVNPSLALTVFTMSTLAFALPAAPGGMGAYEAAFVLSLGWFGVSREQAFAMGLTMHMLQYLPMTIVGLALMAGSRFSLKSLRQN